MRIMLELHLSFEVMVLFVFVMFRR